MAEEPTEFWSGYAMDPVEIALPAGSGFTLRAYRTSDAVTPTDVSEREPEENPFARKPDEPLEDEDLPDFDEDELTRQALGEDSDDADKAAGKGDTSVDLEPVTDEDSADDAEDAAETEEEPAADAEEVPLFLSHKGKVLIFKSTEGLLDFVKSDAPHDLRQLAEWDEFAEAVTADEIEPAEDDAYELDLVVENLRGGHDAWDAPLLLSAGEVARDLAYALRLETVLTMLSPGSPLDDLDEALRAASAGGIGGFMAKRRIRKIGAQQASLGWRTVIGKISSAVDWRD
ncbi:hypothetical protein [Hamadaea tsunoensis]|uniref:hypothetical protein n=1 Tax=Hamadaea tsunoensis TaxID=53368 RepID=UPI0004076582|nr:hypothetical protein [Hamadaea tsunoensis]